MKFLSRLLTVGLFAVFLLGTGVIGNSKTQALSPAAVPNNFAYGSLPASCTSTFLGLDTWYKYLGSEFKSAKHNTFHSASDSKAKIAGPIGGDCTIRCFNFLTQTKDNSCGESRSDVPYVLLAIVNDMLKIVGFVAVAFVIIGAFRFITSSGNPENTAKARNTVINALVGVAIASVAVAFISYLGAKI